MFGGLRQGLRYKEGMTDTATSPQDSNVLNTHTASTGTSLRPYGDKKPDVLSAGTEIQKCASIDAELQTFNSLLSNYNTAMRNIQEEILKNQSASGNSLLGTNVISPDDNKQYYINKFGYPNKYKSDSDFVNRGHNCVIAGNPTSALTHNQWNNFKEMVSYGNKDFNNNSCGLEGDLVTDGSNQIGFLDIYSIPHKFANAKTHNQISILQPSCGGSAKNIGSQFTDIFDQASNAGNSPCLRIPADPKELAALQKANNELVTLIERILKNNECLSKNEVKLQKGIDNTVEQIKKVKKQLDLDNNALNQLVSGNLTAFNNDGVSLNAPDLQQTSVSALNNSQQFVNMNYMRYILGFLVVCVVVFFTIRYWGSEKQPVFVTLLAIILVGYLLWVYFLSRIHIKYK